MGIPLRKSGEYESRPIHLTVEGFAHLKEQLENIRRELPALIAETQRTAAFGDRSDSADYKEAKSALRRANFQILRLQDQIKRVVVIERDSNASVVKMGSAVTVEQNGKTKTYRILGPFEANPALGQISFQSPLGKALMNHTAGDSVTIETPNGQSVYKIIGIA